MVSLGNIFKGADEIHLKKIIAKILTLPLSFYDENNPGRIANRIAKGIENHTWTYPEVAGMMIPKLLRVFGIFIVIWVIQWQIALAFFISFVLIVAFILRDLKDLMQKERILIGTSKIPKVAILRLLLISKLSKLLPQKDRNYIVRNSV
jgi:ABC-type multidrug transport system fused ATPase/permease subunit